MMAFDAGEVRGDTRGIVCDLTPNLRLIDELGREDAIDRPGRFGFGGAQSLARWR
jgi:hypothetical protein